MFCPVLFCIGSELCSAGGFGLTPLADVYAVAFADALLSGLLILLSGQIILRVGRTQATGMWAPGLALLLVVMMFAEIPITSWLLSRYVRSNLRARAISVEYTLSLGMSSATVPMITIMHRAGYGFDVQFILLAISATVVLVATLFLPSENSA